MSLLPLLVALALGPSVPRTTGPNDPIEAPPKELSYNGFYKKCVYFEGLPILGSEKVEDRAFRVIVATFSKMMADASPKVMESMVKRKSHYSIIAFEEGQTDLPEYADMRNDPNTDWNKRARGLGGDITSGGEENILEYKEDRYNGESIFIHEFAHTLSSEGFSQVDPTFLGRLRRAYESAKSNGLWQNTYARTNMYE